MSDAVRPVIVFHGRNEFEAQMARDLLRDAEIPVIHLPSLSTGIFGVAVSTRVAVPEEFVEEALEVLRDAELEAGVEETPRGLAAFEDTMREKFPFHRAPALPEGSHLRRVLTLLFVAAVVIGVYVVLRAR